MLGVILVFELMAVAMAITLTPLRAVIDGNQALLGLPAGYEGVDLFLGVVFTVIAFGLFIAPIAWGMKQVRSR